MGALMQEAEVILSYNGQFNFDKIGQLLNSLENEALVRGISMQLYKKILSVMIESLENIYKYSEYFENEQQLFPKYLPYFELRKTHGFVELITSNPIRNKDVEKLSGKIDLVNNLDREGLRDLFRVTLTNGEFSKKGGAGLGFIEMAKISGQKLDYEITPINNSFSYFTCKVPISLKNNNN